MIHDKNFIPSGLIIVPYQENNRMKNTITNLLFSSMLVVTVASCNTRSRFLDLNTGQAVQKDEKTGVMVNSKTGEPVTVYVDRETNDTIWAKTGKVVNGQVAKNDEGNWVIKVDDEEYKAKSDDGRKIKSEDGEHKVKDDNYKKKVEDDGDVKIKKGDKTIKIDGETGEKKVDND
jgi:hypothetical protein